MIYKNSCLKIHFCEFFSFPRIKVAPSIHPRCACYHEIFTDCRRRKFGMLPAGVWTLSTRLLKNGGTIRHAKSCRVLDWPSTHSVVELDEAMYLYRSHVRWGKIFFQFYIIHLIIRWKNEAISVIRRRVVSDWNTVNFGSIGSLVTNIFIRYIRMIFQCSSTIRIK